MNRRPVLASILSALFMGLGQVYNGEIAKAVFFVILYAVSIAMTYFMIGFLTTPILWVWGVVDAYRSAKKIQKRVPAK
jgi:TM2 domain-containing membrane protein YozV